VIPLVAAVRVGTRRLAWIPIPLFVIWLLLLPFCLLLLPVYVVACRRLQVRAGAGLVAMWRLLHGLRGLHLEVRQGGVDFAVRLV